MAETITDIQELIAYSQESFTDAQEAVLVRCVEMAEQVIKNETNRKNGFGYGTVTDTIFNIGGSSLVKGPLLITSKSPIDPDQAFTLSINDGNSLNVHNYDVDYDNGVVYFSSSEVLRSYQLRGRVPSRFKAVMTYTAGYKTVPPEIWQATALLALHYYRNGGRNTNLQSESFGNYSYSTSSDASEGVYKEVKRLIARYTRYV